MIATPAGKVHGQPLTAEQTLRVIDAITRAFYIKEAERKKQRRETNLFVTIIVVSALFDIFVPDHIQQSDLPGPGWRWLWLAGSVLFWSGVFWLLDRKTKREIADIEAKHVHCTTTFTDDKLELSLKLVAPEAP